MNQRLVWNFEFSKNKPLSLDKLASSDKEDIKWESRFFWSDNQAITLNATDNSLLTLTNYKQKQKKDYYYLLPNSNLNIKRRGQKLLYKPIKAQSPVAIGFGPKINLDEVKTNPNSSEDLSNQLLNILNQTEKTGIEICVKKESFTYKFPTTPPIKLELAKLEMENHVYFSACIEGRSLYLVKLIKEHLLGMQVSCDYVTFLKNILK